MLQPSRHNKYFRMKTILSCIAFLLCIAASAQLTQTIRGTVTDEVLQKPVEGATVLIAGTSHGVITQQDGSFKITGIPIGTVTLFTTSMGYKENTVANITINAGKETVLVIALQPAIHTNEEVIVKTNSKKNQPLNDMSVVSARAFTVEETQKYAAAINDPLRMATAFAGVASADDGNNQIVIRGNSPTGLLWRMEGLDIPNPNHFAATGSSGGGISILSSQLLSNSDFVTGAFAAEYGNALSGVFDVKLRKGNNEKREISLQAGLLGLNAAVEGPFSKNYKGSYLINYRYSTLSILSKLGVNIGDAKSTDFQDLSYNISLPTKKWGSFTLFGFNGFSNQDFTALTDSTKWKTDDDRYASLFTSNTMFNGATHNIAIGKNGRLTTAAGYAYNKLAYKENFLQRPDSAALDYRDNNRTTRFTVNSTYSHRFSNRTTLKTGVIMNAVGFRYYQLSKDNKGAPLEEKINTQNHTTTVQAFSEWQYRVSDAITLNSGLHYLQLLYNNSKSLEPRLSVKWDINKKNTLAFGYGLHSQVQPWGIYLAQLTSDGKTTMPDKDLSFTKAQHFVLSYNRMLSHNFHIKTEVYYQRLYHVPVSPYDSSTLCTLNLQDSYITDALVNKGKGRNYGVEVTLEQYVTSGFYLLFSNSLYQSKYTAIDGIERNTRFNGNYLSTLTTGKEFTFATGKRILGMNLKTVYAGGYRTTPINVAESQQQGYTVYQEKEAYSLQNPAYWRADVRVSMKWNKKNLTSTLSLDIQNLTGRRNVYSQTYDATEKKIITQYQTGFVPVINYKVEF